MRTVLSRNEPSLPSEEYEIPLVVTGVMITTYERCTASESSLLHFKLDHLFRALNEQLPSVPPRSHRWVPIVAASRNPTSIKI